MCRHCSDLLAFLDALTDPCVEEDECIGQWVPSREPGPDGLRLQPVDINGDAL